MITVLHVIKSLVKLLLLIVLLPLFMLWILLRYLMFKHAFVKRLTDEDMPISAAKALAREMNPFRVVKRR
jgi:hypothetical protein